MVSNTYELGPDKKFSPEQITRVTKRAVGEFLENTSSFGSPETLTGFTDKLKELVREALCQRYKIFVQTYWMEDCGQGIRVASKCLWSKETDNFVTVTESRDGWILVVTVFGMYFE